MFSKEHALKRQMQMQESAVAAGGTIPYPKFTFDGKSTVPGLEYVDVYITKLKKHQNEVYVKKIEELKSGKATASSEKYEERQEEMRNRRDKLGEADEAEMLDDDNAALSGYSINSLIALRQILNMTYP
jgi:predicted DsbA family dithiol-disulfide isomerase